MGLVAVSMLAAGVALFAAAGGRLFVPIAPFQLSIRNPRNPVVLSCLAALLAWQADPAVAARMWARAEAYIARAATPIALAIAVVVGLAAVQYGAFIAGGADSSGYLSQARLWRTLTFERPYTIAPVVDWPDEALAFAPLGYRPATTGAGSVPIYPPGLPMSMALAQVAFGERAAFFVVPLSAAGTVFLAFLIGRRLGGEATGLVSAAIVAVSPIFLFQAMQQMSDVPATFWWMLTFYLLMRGTPAATVGAGLAAGMGGLVRPNLWILVAAAVPIVAWWRRPGTSPVARAACFVAGALPPALAYLAWNLSLYGSPFESGYGPTGNYVAAAHAWPNVKRYAEWTMWLQGPPILLALVAPAVAFALRPSKPASESAARTAVSALVLYGVLQLFFLFYLVFDAWPALRFLLPAIPLLLILQAFVIVKGLSWLSAGLRRAVLFIVLVALVTFGVRRSTEIGVFATAEDGSRYERTAVAAAARVPPEAVVFSMLHSGSLAYYTGLAVARWDVVPGGALGRYADDLQAHGHPAFLLIDDLERPDFESRHGAEFAAVSDASGVWLVEPPVGVRLYDLSQRFRTGAVPSDR